MVDLTYLPGVIPFTFLIYLLIVVPAYYVYLQRHRSSSSALTAWEGFCAGKPFHFTYTSPHGAYGIYFLLIWRLLCFGYFLGVVFLYGYVLFDGVNAFYFTLWNIDLIALYYCLASIASLVGVCCGSEVSEKVSKFGDALQILFAVVTATAFFVTVVNFTTLSRAFVEWNVNYHFMTTMSLLVEIAFNGISVRAEHVIFQVTWCLAYAVFAWPMVALGALKEWPYFFMETDHAAVFVWYIVLFVVDVVFYFVLFWIVYLKESVIGSQLQEPQAAKPKLQRVPDEENHLQIVPFSS